MSWQTVGHDGLHAMRLKNIMPQRRSLMECLQTQYTDFTDASWRVGSESSSSSGWPPPAVRLAAA
eukprot:CAMPEP_0115303698 /NCGR_PEP_ID=MMETSP0270-20121206/71057_1 /TAXON_ID=71861 /ORGANISM="Scrippsiella trochoidea, Strain CCMP3099" /LENGTH=64 /DNA_ID=CAMNT_0002721713 /DNA_START=75 /DNA_END=269 /DNA_ORIENTATION=-